MKNKKIFELLKEEIEKYINDTMTDILIFEPEYFGIKENYDWAAGYIRATLYKEYGIEEEE